VLLPRFPGQETRLARDRNIPTPYNFTVNNVGTGPAGLSTGTFTMPAGGANENTQGGLGGAYGDSNKNSTGGVGTRKSKDQGDQNSKGGSATTTYKAPRTPEHFVYFQPATKVLQAGTPVGLQAGGVDKRSGQALPLVLLLMLLAGIGLFVFF